jgi:hypothetical protein
MNRQRHCVRPPHLGDIYARNADEHTLAASPQLEPHRFKPPSYAWTSHEVVF